MRSVALTPTAFAVHAHSALYNKSTRLFPKPAAREQGVPAQADTGPEDSWLLAILGSRGVQQQPGPLPSRSQKDVPCPSPDPESQESKMSPGFAKCPQEGRALGAKLPSAQNQVRACLVHEAC